MQVAISVESPLQDEVREVVGEFNAHVGSAILDRIVALAREEGIGRLVLETGDRHPEAWRLYKSHEFSRCGPVPDRRGSSWAVFYEKALAPAELA